MNERIPKIKKTEIKNNLQPVNIKNRDVQNLVREINSTCLDTEFRNGWDLLEISMVHNSKLEANYKEKRAELKDEGRMAQSLQDQIGFLAVSPFRKTVIARKGLEVSKQVFNRLGQGECGVYINRHFDVELKSMCNGKDANSPKEIFVFKYFPGKRKAVAVPYLCVKESSLEPTPNFDCHVSSVQPNTADKDFRQMALSSIYLYEYTEACEPSKCPRQCLPYAVIKCVKHPVPKPDVTPQVSSIKEIHPIPTVSKDISHSVTTATPSTDGNEALVNIHKRQEPPPTCVQNIPSILTLNLVSNSVVNPNVLNDPALSSNMLTNPGSSEMSSPLKNNKHFKDPATNFRKAEQKSMMEGSKAEYVARLLAATAIVHDNKTPKTLKGIDGLLPLFARSNSYPYAENNSSTAQSSTSTHLYSNAEIRDPRLKVVRKPLENQGESFLASGNKETSATPAPIHHRRHSSNVKKKMSYYEYMLQRAADKEREEKDKVITENSVVLSKEKLVDPTSLRVPSLKESDSESDIDLIPIGKSNAQMLQSPSSLNFYKKNQSLLSPQKCSSNLFQSLTLNPGPIMPSVPVSSHSSLPKPPRPSGKAKKLLPLPVLNDDGSITNVYRGIVNGTFKEINSVSTSLLSSKLPSPCQSFPGKESPLQNFKSDHEDTNQEATDSDDCSKMKDVSKENNKPPANTTASKPVDRESAGKLFTALKNVFEKKKKIIERKLLDGKKEEAASSMDEEATDETSQQRENSCASSVLFSTVCDRSKDKSSKPTVDKRLEQPVKFLKENPLVKADLKKEKGESERKPALSDKIDKDRKKQMNGKCQADKRSVEITRDKKLVCDKTDAVEDKVVVTKEDKKPGEKKVVVKRKLMIEKNDIPRKIHAMDNDTTDIMRQPCAHVGKNKEHQQKQLVTNLAKETVEKISKLNVKQKERKQTSDKNKDYLETNLIEHCLPETNVCNEHSALAESNPCEGNEHSALEESNPCEGNEHSALEESNPCEGNEHSALDENDPFSSGADEGIKRSVIDESNPFVPVKFYYPRFVCRSPNADIPGINLNTLDFSAKPLSSQAYCSPLRLIPSLCDDPMETEEQKETEVPSLSSTELSFVLENNSKVQDNTEVKASSKVCVKKSLSVKTQEKDNSLTDDVQDTIEKASSEACFTKSFSVKTQEKDNSLTDDVQDKIEKPPSEACFKKSFSVKTQEKDNSLTDDVQDKIEKASSEACFTKSFSVKTQEKDNSLTDDMQDKIEKASSEACFTKSLSVKTQEKVNSLSDPINVQDKMGKAFSEACFKSSLSVETQKKNNSLSEDVQVTQSDQCKLNTEKKLEKREENLSLLDLNPTPSVMMLEPPRTNLGKNDTGESSECRELALESTGSWVGLTSSTNTEMGNRKIDSKVFSSSVECGSYFASSLSEHMEEEGSDVRRDSYESYDGPMEERVVPLPRSLSMQEMGITCYLQVLSEKKYQPSTLLVDYKMALEEGYHQGACHVCKKELTKVVTAGHESDKFCGNDEDTSDEKGMSTNVCESSLVSTDHCRRNTTECENSNLINKESGNCAGGTVKYRPHNNLYCNNDKIFPIQLSFLQGDVDSDSDINSPNLVIDENSPDQPLKQNGMSEKESSSFLFKETKDSRESDCLVNMLSEEDPLFDKKSGHESSKGRQLDLKKLKRMRERLKEKCVESTTERLQTVSGEHNDEHNTTKTDLADVVDDDDLRDTLLDDMLSNSSAKSSASISDKLLCRDVVREEVESNNEESHSLNNDPLKTILPDHKSGKSNYSDMLEMFNIDTKESRLTAESTKEISCSKKNKVLNMIPRAAQKFLKKQKEDRAEEKILNHDSTPNYRKDGKCEPEHEESQTENNSNEAAAFLSKTSIKGGNDKSHFVAQKCDNSCDTNNVEKKDSNEAGTRRMITTKWKPITTFDESAVIDKPCEAPSDGHNKAIHFTLNSKGKSDIKSYPYQVSRIMAVRDQNSMIQCLSEVNVLRTQVVKKNVIGQVQDIQSNAGAENEKFVTNDSSKSIQKEVVMEQDMNEMTNKCDNMKSNQEDKGPSQNCTDSESKSKVSSAQTVDETFEEINSSPFDMYSNQPLGDVDYRIGFPPKRLHALHPSVASLQDGYSSMSLSQPNNLISKNYQGQIDDNGDVDYRYMWSSTSSQGVTPKHMHFPSQHDSMPLNRPCENTPLSFTGIDLPAQQLKSSPESYAPPCLAKNTESFKNENGITEWHGNKNLEPSKTFSGDSITDDRKLTSWPSFQGIDVSIVPDQHPAMDEDDAKVLIKVEKPTCGDGADQGEHPITSDNSVVIDNQQITEINLKASCDISEDKEETFNEPLIDRGETVKDLGLEMSADSLLHDRKDKCVTDDTEPKMSFTSEQVTTVTQTELCNEFQGYSSSSSFDFSDQSGQWLKPGCPASKVEREEEDCCNIDLGLEKNLPEKSGSCEEIQCGNITALTYTSQVTNIESCDDKSMSNTKLDEKPGVISTTTNVNETMLPNNKSLVDPHSITAKALFETEKLLREMQSNTGSNSLLPVQEEMEKNYSANDQQHKKGENNNYGQILKSNLCQEDVALNKEVPPIESSVTNEHRESGAVTLSSSIIEAEECNNALDNIKKHLPEMLGTFTKLQKELSEMYSDDDASDEEVCHTEATCQQGPEGLSAGLNQQIHTEKISLSSDHISMLRRAVDTVQALIPKSQHSEKDECPSPGDVCPPPIVSTQTIHSSISDNETANGLANFPLSSNLSDNKNIHLPEKSVDLCEKYGNGHEKSVNLCEKLVGLPEKFTDILQKLAFPEKSLELELSKSKESCLARNKEVASGLSSKSSQQIEISEENSFTSSAHQEKIRVARETEISSCCSDQDKRKNISDEDRLKRLSSSLVPAFLTSTSTECWHNTKMPTGPSAHQNPLLTKESRLTAESTKEIFCPEKDKVLNMIPITTEEFLIERKEESVNASASPKKCHPPSKLKPDPSTEYLDCVSNVEKSPPNNNDKGDGSDGKAKDSPKVFLSDVPMEALSLAKYHLLKQLVMLSDDDEEEEDRTITESFVSDVGRKMEDKEDEEEVYKEVICVTDKESVESLSDSDDLQHKSKRSVILDGKIYKASDKKDVVVISDSDTDTTKVSSECDEKSKKRKVIRDRPLCYSHISQKSPTRKLKNEYVDISSESESSHKNSPTRKSPFPKDFKEDETCVNNSKFQDLKIHFDNTNNMNKTVTSVKKIQRVVTVTMESDSVEVYNSKTESSKVTEKRSRNMERLVHVSRKRSNDSLKESRRDCEDSWSDSGKMRNNLIRPNSTEKDSESSPERWINEIWDKSTRYLKDSPLIARTRIIVNEDLSTPETRSNIASEKKINDELKESKRDFVDDSWSDSWSDSSSSSKRRKYLIQPNYTEKSRGPSPERLINGLRDKTARYMDSPLLSHSRIIRNDDSSTPVRLRQFSNERSKSKSNSPSRHRRRSLTPENRNENFRRQSTSYPDSPVFDEDIRIYNKSRSANHFSSSRDKKSPENYTRKFVYGEESATYSNFSPRNHHKRNRRSPSFGKSGSYSSISSQEDSYFLTEKSYSRQDPYKHPVVRAVSDRNYKQRSDLFQYYPNSTNKRNLSPSGRHTDKSRSRFEMSPTRERPRERQHPLDELMRPQKRKMHEVDSKDLDYYISRKKVHY